MKKHILGFAIFSLIIGTTVFVSAMFYKQVKPNPTIAFNYEVNSRSCWRQPKQTVEVSPSSVKIVQAVFNAETKQVVIDFVTPTEQNVEIGLEYYKTRNLDLTRLDFNKELRLIPNSENRSKQVIDLSDKWLNDVKPTDAMYITVYSSKRLVGNGQSLNINSVPVLIAPKE